MEWSTNAIIVKNYTWQDYNAQDRLNLDSTLTNIDKIAHQIGLTMLLSSYDYFVDTQIDINNIDSLLQTKIAAIQTETSNCVMNTHVHDTDCKNNAPEGSKRIIIPQQKYVVLCFGICFLKATSFVVNE